MVHTTFQSQIHGFKPLDTIRKVKYELLQLEDEQRYFLERCHPAYEFRAPTAKAGVLKLKTGEEVSDSEDGKKKNEQKIGLRGVGEVEEVNVSLFVVNLAAWAGADYT